MKRLAPWMLLCLPSPVLAQPIDPLAIGTYTNEEQVYFDGEAGRTPPPWTGVTIAGQGDGLVWQGIDRFGAALASEPLRVTAAAWTIGTCTLAFKPADGDAIGFAPAGSGCAGRALPVRLDAQGMTLRLADGRETRLLRARPFTCWMTVKRDAPKADGSEDWLFQAGMKTHDQGGRLRLGGGDTGAPEAIIRIRNVVWPPPTRNRPSIVLYVFTPDDMNRAVAYGWADPAAVRVGINQRWMQASCTLDGAE
ncbi:MAG: hypothetical protein Q27BB25_15790 [Blastomonas sp. CACIA14H2]|uniref:hypothetical protein n=1 Tax=Blastomonas sp. CACIA14H2 TaxID=1419876 RepID=UPI0003CFB944|nr:MAG: hypothetical protein Q27BB25_15790 [Blastomonas sp. CACIA14H2]